MLQTQYSRLQNLTSQSNYRYNTIYLNEQKTTHFHKRLQQIYNQFDLVDFQKKGYLYRGEIQSYLQSKYQWVNKDILNSLFKAMDWQRNQATQDLYVTRQQYCSKYLKHQKQLFYEFNKLDSQKQWFYSLYNIYQKTSHLKPLYYASVQILKLQLYKTEDDFVNIEAKYQNHQEKLSFDINQKSYDITQPSFELILPAQENQFFVSYRFTSVKDSDIVYGNTYVQIDLTKNILESYILNLQVKKNGIVVGLCRIYVTIQAKSSIIKQKLRQKSISIQQSSQPVKSSQFSLLESKTKQYQYIQFLWGIKHLPSQQILSQNIGLIVILRTALIVALGLVGICVHVLGRCQPLSIICVFLLLKWRTYVILKVQVFMMTWMIVASMLLDGIWLVFSSHHISQINYLNLTSAMFFTYILLGIKVCFFIYLLIFENPFKSGQQRKE